MNFYEFLKSTLSKFKVLIPNKIRTGDILTYVACIYVFVHTVHERYVSVCICVLSNSGRGLWYCELEVY